MLQRTSSASSLGPPKPPKVLPTRSEDYELLEEIGQGVSAKARGPSVWAGILRVCWRAAALVGRA